MTVLVGGLRALTLTRMALHMAYSLIGPRC